LCVLYTQQARVGETIGSLSSNNEFTSLNLPALGIIHDQFLRRTSQSEAANTIV